jgi:hypothetical protein
MSNDGAKSTRGEKESGDKSTHSKLPLHINKHVVAFEAD